MGGHGGLNILPQKSWNVYGQRNRQKVAEDEAEEAEREAAVAKQRAKGDRQARLDVLRHENRSEPDRGKPNHDNDQELDCKKHINFWASFEAASSNPEAQAEKKHAARSRGDPKTQTSDARFDASFAVMHGLSNRAPWYARAQQSLYKSESSSQDAAQQRHETRDRRASGSFRPAVKPTESFRAFEQTGARSDLAAMVGNGALGGVQFEQMDARRGDDGAEERSERRSKHKRKSKRDSESCCSLHKSSKISKTVQSGGSDLIAKLRRERLERERVESRRSREILRQHYQ